MFMLCITKDTTIYACFDTFSFSYNKGTMGHSSSRPGVSIVNGYCTLLEIFSNKPAQSEHKDMMIHRKAV